MPLSAPTVARTHKHTRSVRFEGYARADGLWDIEGRITDTKPEDYRLAPGLLPAGSPVHEMCVRLTIDRKLNVVAAETESAATPYPPHCAAIAPHYVELAGLNLGRGFRRAVQERFGGVRGCTHITELLLQFPTAAIQTLAAEPVEDESRKPFQLDRCHALDTAGEAVRLYYPAWRREAKTGTD